MKTIAFICICVVLSTCQAKDQDKDLLSKLASSFYNNLKVNLDSQVLAQQAQRTQTETQDSISELDQLTAQLETLANELDLSPEEIRAAILSKIDAVLTKIDSELNSSGGLA